MERCHRNVCISVHVRIVFASVSVCDSVPESVFVRMTLLFCPVRVAVLFSALAPLYVFVLTPRTRPSVCQCLSVFPAAWLCTCCCAICASSWCLAGVILFSVLNHPACVCSFHPPHVCIVPSSLLQLSTG